MELKIKNQYSYMIYPYIVEEKKYDKYLLELLKNKHCKLKVWNKKDNLNIYTYFTKNIRDNVFWTFSYKDENSKYIDKELKSRLLSQKQMVMFEYDLGEKIQGKIGDKILFFDIEKIQVACFKPGICFIILKNTLGKQADIGEVLNFNNKFRNINKYIEATKEDENIKIQSDSLEDITELSKIIKEIMGTNQDTKQKKITEERILTYTYMCIDKEGWNKKVKPEEIKNEFTKLYRILPENSVDENIDSEFDQTMDLGDFLKVGFSMQGTGIFSSNEEAQNALKMPYVFEEEYLYTYLLTTYKRLYIKKMNMDFEREKKFEKTREKLEGFTKDIWIQPITKDAQGIKLCEKWENTLQTNYIYEKLKLDMRLQNNM